MWMLGWAVLVLSQFHWTSRLNLPFTSINFRSSNLIVREEGKVRLYFKKSSSPLLPPSEEAEWKPFYAVDEDFPQKELSYFDEPMEAVYTDHNSVMTPFCTSLRIVGFVRAEGAGRKCVALKDYTLLLENESHHLDPVTLKSAEELLEMVDRYFPLLSEDARRAVKSVCDT